MKSLPRLCPIGCVSALLLTVFFFGCAPAEDSGSDSTESDRLTIAAIPKATGGDFWETVEVGARRAASELGIELKWEGTLTETEIAEQTKIIENMINLGVDAIALAPLNNQAQRKPVQSAVDNGVPVVIFDSAVDGDAHSSFIATDNVLGGALGARFVAEKRPSAKRVIIFRYVQGTASTTKLTDLSMLLKNWEWKSLPIPILSLNARRLKKVVANTERFIADGRLDIDAAFAANLTTTLGVSSALDDLKDSGIEVDIVFVGFDSSKKLVEGVQGEKIDALIVQSPEKMGYMAVKTAASVAQGETAPALIDTGVEVVTAERIKNESEIRTLVGLE